MSAASLREAWLTDSMTFLNVHLLKHALPEVSARVSCGWPSAGGLGQGKTVIGQCFAPTVCKDGKPQIFISPRLSDSIEVLAVLLHEMLHASVGVEHGHKKAFSQAARAVGLDGPPTATVASEVLKAFFLSYVSEVGAYPHAAIEPPLKEKKGSRLRLFQCECEDPVKVRVARDLFPARCLVCDALFTQVVKEP